MDGLIKCCSCLREICIIPSSPTEATINYCFVYVGHASKNGSFPVNASNLEMMRGPFPEYQITQYSRETDEGGLFVDYINRFLKLKPEASGYHNWVRKPKTKSGIFSPLGSVRESSRTRHRSSTTLRNEVWQNCVWTLCGGNWLREIIEHRLN